MSQNISPQMNINSRITVEELQFYLHGHELSPDIPQSQEYIKCDYCSAKVYEGEEFELSQYLCDDVLNDSHTKSPMIHQKAFVDAISNVLLILL